MNNLESRKAPTALVVDLDGTLVRSDTLWELFVRGLNTAPLPTLARLKFIFTPARFKCELADLVSLDVASLPYDQAVLDLIRERREAGARVILATAASERVAEAVAAHLECFDRVLGSTPHLNAKGPAKLERINAELGGDEFDYVGNSKDDVPIWLEASSIFLASASPGSERLAESCGDAPGSSTVISHKGGSFAVLLSALRWHQWAKNALVFVPMLAAHRFFELPLWISLIVAFAMLCCLSSAIYVFNDLGDLESDRKHPTKASRPFASGAFPLHLGLALFATLLVAAFVLAVFSGANVALWAGVYVLTATLYSVRLKRIIILDAIVLAALYTIRLLVGVAATGIPLSFWLLGFSLFIFLGLAFLKRYSELRTIDSVGAHSGRSYVAEDEQIIRELGLASSFSGILMFALYLNSQTVRELYLRPKILWLLVPLMLYWVGILWVRASRGELVGDPVTYALRRKESIVPLAVGAIIFLVAAFWRHP